MSCSRWPTLLFWTGFALLAAGMVFNAPWRAIAATPLAGLIVLGLISLALEAGVRRVFHITRTTAMLAVWVCAAFWFSGLASVLGVMLLAGAAVAIGSLLLPAGHAGAGHGDSIALTMLLGLALLCGIMGWLLPFPVHWRVVYLPMLVVVIALRWRAVVRAGRTARAAWSTAVVAAPRAAFLTILCMGIASTCAWLPALSYDALVYHLALPSQLAQLGYYQMDAGSNVWALAPWAADVLQGMAWVLAGGESAGAVGLLWFGLAMVLLWRLARELDLAPWLCWMAVALFGSLPLVAGLLASMQTEGPTATVLAGVALLIQRRLPPQRRHLLAVGVLMGLLLALKVSNLMFAGPLGLWLLWRWRSCLPWRALPLALLLGGIVAGSSYVYAYVLTGNPVLPLFNGYFHSVFYPLANFHDQRWDTGLSWRLPWQLVFASSVYDEAGNGVGPFVLIALGGSLLVALCRRHSAGLAWVALVAFALPLTQIQYLRYAMPVLVLMIPAMLCGMRCEAMAPRLLRRVAYALGVLAVANLVLLSSATWQLKSGALLKRLGGGQDRVVQRYAVERRFADVVRQRYGDRARTLLTDPARPFAAPFAGRGLVTAWYDPQLSALAAHARSTDSAAAWRRLFDASGANLVLVSKAGPSAGMTSAIAACHGESVLAVEGTRLWELHPQAAAGAASAPVDLVASRDLALRLRSKLVPWGTELRARMPGT